MFCEECGTQVKDDAKFCPNCGANLTEGDIRKNDVKTFVLGTHEEREKRKAFIERQMEKSKKIVSEQMKNGKRILSEQKKRMDEERIQQRIEKDARREIEEKAKQEAMIKIQKEREEQAKFQQEDKENQQTNRNYYQNTQTVEENFQGMKNDGRDYTPISMWGYFGYNILFWIPLIGTILALVFAFGGTKNINLRNYARSQFCTQILAVIIFLIIFGSVGSLLLF